MSKQLSLIEDSPTLESLPSAKVKITDKVGVHSWTNFYASFSEGFVDYAIKALDIQKNDVIFDPFVGAGTTLVASQKNNISAVGVDIDPFSCLLSRAKVATNIDINEVKKLLKPTKSQKILSSFSKEAFQIFDDDCLRYASIVFSRIVKKIGVSKDKVLTTILDDTNGKFDSEVLALTALCIGSSESAKLIRGSNPTWYRKAEEGEKDTFEALFEATSKACDKMHGDLAKIQPSTKMVRVVNGDIKNEIANLEQGFANIIITSPPYLTRIDYAVKHLPNLSILSGLVNFSFDELRKKMIGTPKIINKGEFDSKWGDLCVETLKSIQDHKSYASESYYIWTYYQYFDALYKTFINFKKYLQADGKGIVVLQDSFYKELHIPLSDIAVEMLISLGFEAEVIVKDEVRINMSQLNPAHLQKKLKSKASEDVIYFQLN